VYMVMSRHQNTGKVKSKVVPVFFTLSSTPRKRSEGVDIQLHALLTSALDGSRQLHGPAALTPVRESLVPIVQEAGWAPDPVWTRL
jgi:hypothetical protein